MAAQSSKPLVASAVRSQELLVEVARVHALDQKRILSGELRPSDLHFLAPERARVAKITWNFGRRRKA
jgi:hypothetical protein